MKIFVVVKNPDRLASFLTGLAALLDGLVRTLTLGFVCSRFHMLALNWGMRRMFAAAKVKRAAELKSEVNLSTGVNNHDQAD